jgi:hypothetical protein
VADGVGGWALSGVDSGEYSRLLMQMAQLFAESKKLDAHPKKVRGRCASTQLPCSGSHPWRSAAPVHRGISSGPSDDMNITNKMGRRCCC